MITTLDLSFRLAAAVLSGSLIGINREMHAKPVGVRTLGLVSLGSALVTLAGSGFSGDLTDANASRAIQGIVTGIGFLGAGVIVKGESKKNVHGLTTAAAIWVTAALGIVCGLGAFMPVAIALGLMLLLLSVGGFVDRAVHDHWERKRVVKTDDDGTILRPGDQTDGK
jgi:putative Mg2+ transporter-C (MgtC) family protein